MIINFFTHAKTHFPRMKCSSGECFFITKRLRRGWHPLPPIDPFPLAIPTLTTKVRPGEYRDQPSRPLCYCNTL